MINSGLTLPPKLASSVCLGNRLGMNLSQYLSHFGNLCPLNESEVRDWCQRNHVDILETSSLALLTALPQCPPYIFVRGNTDVLHSSCFAIVGTRTPRPEGRANAFRFSRALAREGLVIVSGLARGIDRFAHEGALAGPGLTVAVLGHGLDRIYPPENRQLAQKIVANGGTILSQFPPLVPPLPGHFPARNRIIAGLALGVLVVEAAEKSGSLITAGFAAEWGREVFVIPGGLQDSNFGGVHRLIQDGATVVCSPEEVGNFYRGNALRRPTSSEQEPPIDEALRRIFGSSPRTLDELLSGAPWRPAEVVERLCRALESGSIVEVSPQTFLWTQQLPS